MSSPLAPRGSTPRDGRIQQNEWPDDGAGRLALVGLLLVGAILLAGLRLVF